jgi:tyrosine-protein kinase Etk/Wzc
LLAVYLFLGASIGGILGFCYAFMTSLSDGALVSSSQIETKLGIPCIAVLPISPKSSPIVGGAKDPILRGVPDLGLLLDRVLSLSTHGEFSVSGWCPVTAAQRCSGLVADLARLMAEEGRRVVVIDLHFDDPRISMALGVMVNRGLAQWLLSEESISSALNPVPVPSRGKLAVIAPIQADRHLVEMIVRRQMATLVGELSKDWDHVLIDAPSLIADRSLEMVLPRYSNLILTAEYRTTRMSDLTQACSAGRSREWRVKGVVITDAPRQSV